MEKKKLIPIITIVLYFGKVRWSKPITVKKALTQEYNADIKFVNNICDYKMNLYEISFLSEEIRNKFTSDFKIIADYFAGTRKNITDYKPTGQKIVHLKEFLYFMDVFAEDSRFGTMVISSLLVAMAFHRKPQCAYYIKRIVRYS